MCDISVIIPVFNVSNYLNKCLDSVINQSFQNIEIICVNDGSTDNSLEILNEYAQKDKRIKIITQNNKGLGAARNVGLKYSSGKYIYFLDSDDYIDSTTLEKLYNNIISNDSDVVLFKFQTFNGDNNIHKRGSEFRIDKIFGNIEYSNFTFNYKDVKKHVLNSAFSACLKLYKKDLIQFKFPENIFFEDVLFHVKVMINASKISFVNEELYYYRSNENSILNSSANELDIFKVISMVEDYLNENDYLDEFEKEFRDFKITQILQYIISSNSESYYKKAKFEFENINSSSNFKNYDEFKLVLNSKNYNEFILSYYKYHIDDLEKNNQLLLEQNNYLRKINNELLSSRSWKITKPLRFLKIFLKR